MDAGSHVNSLPVGDAATGGPVKLEGTVAVRDGSAIESQGLGSSGRGTKVNEAVACIARISVSWRSILCLLLAVPRELVPDHLDVNLLTELEPDVAEESLVHPGLKLAHPAQVSTMFDKSIARYHIPDGGLAIGGARSTILRARSGAAGDIGSGGAAGRLLLLNGTLRSGWVGARRRLGSLLLLGVIEIVRHLASTVSFHPATPQHLRPSSSPSIEYPESLIQRFAGSAIPRIKVTTNADGESNKRIFE